MIVIKRTELDKQVLQGIEFSDIEDDGTKYLGKKVAKPWGYEICRYEDTHCSVWWLHLDPLKETSMHCHPRKVTLLIVRGGEATLSTLHGKHELVPGSLVMIEAGAFHRTTSNGGPVVLYELESPSNKRDLIRLTDSYGRGQGYETNN